jgi:radical SAM-linked protein
MTAAPTVLRVRWTRHGKIRFLGHRDTARVWERTLRRVGMPVAWTEGFTPRPRVSFGLALPTGAESDGEYLEVRLHRPELVGPADGEPLRLEALPARLTEALPEGMAVTAVALTEPGGPSLQESVSSCSWWVELRGADRAEAEAVIRSVMDAPELKWLRERKGRATVVDLRPAVRSLRVDGPTEAGWGLHAELDAQPRTVRPTELLAATPGGERLVCGRWRRTHQWISHDGERREPLAVCAMRKASDDLEQRGAGNPRSRAGELRPT